MTENDMDALLSFYAPGRVPGYEDIRVDDDVVWRFDGTYGFM